MVNKQFSKFEKGLIVAYIDCELSLHNIAKKLNYHQILIVINYLNNLCQLSFSLSKCLIKCENLFY